MSQRLEETIGVITTSTTISTLVKRNWTTEILTGHSQEGLRPLLGNVSIEDMLSI